MSANYGNPLIRIPTKLSEFENDTEFITASSIPGEYLTESELNDKVLELDQKYAPSGDYVTQADFQEHTSGQSSINNSVNQQLQSLESDLDNLQIPTIPGNATTTSSGLMSAADKQKLNNVATNATATKITFVRW